MAEIRINATGELKLYDSDDSNYVSFKSAGTVSSNVAWVLPSADGSSGQALTTDGSGTLSWADAGSADPSSADGDSLGTASAEWSDLYLADGGIVYFGNDQDIRLTHNADKGLILKHSATADDKPVILTLQTGETDMAANDVIGKIEFQAPDEGTGTDAVLVSAAIQAVAEGDHSSSSNATRIEFMVGASEAAAKKMQLTSAGKLEVDGGLDVEGGVVFNEDSADVDFRVESNGEANIFAVNGGDDIVLLRKASNTSSASGTNGVLKIMTNDNAGGQMQLGSNDAGYSWIQASDGSSGYPLRLQENGSSVTINTTETAYSNLTDHSDNGIILTTASSSIFATNNGATMVVARTNNDNNNRDIINFNRNGSTCGQITGTNSATTFATSSDYRLKENVNYNFDATTRLKQLKPARFNFIADETNTLVDGFIAHEVSSIVPEAITGEKDAMEVETRYTADDVETQGDSPSKKVGDTKTYSSTKIKPQGIDQSKLVPLLVKTVQELEARIKTLEDA